jgi:hypothetical protein
MDHGKSAGDTSVSYEAQLSLQKLQVLAMVHGKSAGDTSVNYRVQ